MAGRPTNEPGNYFALGVQSAKDVEATTFHFFKHLDGTGFDVDEDVTSEREGGDGQEVGLRYKTRIKADGQAVANARPDTAGKLLAWALGMDTPSIVATSGPTSAIVALVNHQLQPVASLPYLTVEQAYADEVERCPNEIINALTIEGEAGKPIKITAQYISGGSPYLRSAQMTPAREVGPPFFQPGASVAVDGVGGAKVTKWKVEVKRGVDESIQTTGLNRDDVVPLNFEVDCDFTLKYESASMVNKITYGGGTTVPIDLATGSFNLFVPQSGNASGALQVGLPMLDYVGAKVNKLDPDGKTMYLDVAAMTRRSGTNSIFANVLSQATAAYR